MCPVWRLSMKIIVTGGAGFVGSHTCKALREKGYTVLNFDLKTGYDIRNSYQLDKVISKGDKVLHLAAVSRFKEADDNPWLAYETNVLGTRNVAMACKINKAERLIYSSTGSVYMPIEEEPPITEKFKCRGNSVYACTKYLGELAIKREGPPFIILRYAHLYGEGRMDHGAIGAFLSRVERGLQPTLYGGSQSNDFTYIKDVVQANILALETDKLTNLNEVYNIGTGEELSTETVFNLLAKYMGYKGDFLVLPYRSVDPKRFVYDISKAKRMLGYNPQYTFKKGMEDYLEHGISEE